MSLAACFLVEVWRQNLQPHRVDLGDVPHIHVLCVVHLHQVADYVDSHLDRVSKKVLIFLIQKHLQLQ